VKIAARKTVLTNLERAVAAIQPLDHKELTYLAARIRELLGWNRRGRKPQDKGE
jgi:hypothetical protein